MTVPLAAGVRIGWTDLPEEVREWVGGVLGAPVTSAVSQPGGFSPGSADRVVTEAGARAFVKAVSPAQNPRTPELHRQEARIAARLPAGVPAPRLLGSYDDGTWVALVLEDVDGRHPVTPWEAGELRSVLRALESLVRHGTPSPVADLGSAGKVLEGDFEGWSRLAEEPAADLDDWAVAHLAELRALAARGSAVIAGDTLCHLDVRADNLLLRDDGSVVLIDWPWACRAAPWLDSLALLVNVELFGGHDAEELIGISAPLREAPPEDLTAALAGLTGYFLDVARRPPSPGLPTVRAFQRVNGDAALGWLRRRLEGGAAEGRR